MARAALSYSSGEALLLDDDSLSNQPGHLTVFDVKENELGPKVGLLSGLDDLGDVDPSIEQLQVFHDYRAGVRYLLWRFAKNQVTYAFPGGIWRTIHSVRLREGQHELHIPWKLVPALTEHSHVSSLKA